MMRVGDLITTIEHIAPTQYAESWDKVGLHVGDRDRDLRGPVFLTIDLTERVLAEAIALKAGAIVAYHPPIWDPLTKVTSATPRQRVILHAIEAGIALYSPHTALDAMPGGVTDWLCEGLSGSATPGRIHGDCRALAAHGTLEPTQEVKVVTFVDQANVDKVRNALASAGAGIIGGYQLCSFAMPGTGSFFGGEGTKPAVGKTGRLEEVPEVRMEMVCSKAALPLAMETLRRFHPYEEPAIDIIPLLPQPTRAIGAGRRLVLDRPATVAELATRLKAFIKRDRVRYALTGETDKPITHIGVVPGAGESLSRLARAEGCDLFVTGEMKHHDVLGALNAGMSVLLGGHTSTERGYLPRLRDRLAAAMPGVEVLVSQEDRDTLITV
jgi:dinuclear metal center YbgI/SA1388 family protein